MIYKSGFFCLCLLARGVFGVDGVEVKSVSVLEGDSVTLHTDITQMQRDDQILWMFKTNNTDTRIAEIYKQIISIYGTDDKSFRDRLKLDSQTGSLTITNITITKSGLYKLNIISKTVSYRNFNVSVYAHLPVPVISSNSSNCSSSLSSSISKCVLLCSVINVRDVRDVSLSWYKGNSLLSSISVSDLNIRLSLSLEVEYQDTNTYRCVLNNTITNQTQHLNIKDVCQCSGNKNISSSHRVGIAVGSVILVVTVAVLVTSIYFCWKRINKVEEVITNEDVLYSKTTFCARGVQGSKAVEEDHVVYSSVT